MSVKRVFGTIVLELWINMQNQLGDLAPICSLRISIEHSQIGYDVLLVVNRENSIRRRDIRNVGIWGWFLHDSAILLGIDK